MKFRITMEWPKSLADVYILQKSFGSSSRFSDMFAATHAKTAD